MRLISLIIAFNLTGFVFGAEGGERHNIGQGILDRLRANDPSLTELYLGDNQIGDAGARALAEALKVNTSLTELKFSYNQIGDVLTQRINRLMSSEGLYHERRALVPWSIPRHMQEASWNPHVSPVVRTVFFCEQRLWESLDDNVLPYLTDDIWEEILKCLRCGDFGKQQALLAP